MSEIKKMIVEVEIEAHELEQFQKHLEAFQENKKVFQSQKLFESSLFFINKLLSKNNFYTRCRHTGEAKLLNGKIIQEKIDNWGKSLFKDIIVFEEFKSYHSGGEYDAGIDFFGWIDGKYIYTKSNIIWEIGKYSNETRRNFFKNLISDKIIILQNGKLSMPIKIHKLEIGDTKLVKIDSTKFKLGQHA